MELIIPTFESVALLLGIGMLGFWMLSRKILFGEAISFHFISRDNTLGIYLFGYFFTLQ